MNFKFRNLSTISDRHPFVEVGVGLRGITILKGKNGSSKSTAARAMFCTVNGFYQMEETITSIKIAKIKARLRRVNGKENRDENNVSLHHKVATQIYHEALNQTDTMAYLTETIKTAFPAEENQAEKGIDYPAVLGTAVAEIAEILQREASDIMAPFVMKYFDNEFKGEISNVHSKEQVTEFTVETYRENTFKIKNNKEVVLERLFSVPNRAFYLDNVFAMDMAHDAGESDVDELITTRGNILRQAHLMMFLSEAEQTVEPAVQKVIDRIGKIIGGQVYKQKRDFVYQQKNKENTIRLVNVSTALKPFMMIQRLLQNGSLIPGGILILDKIDVYLDEKYKKYLDALIIVLNKELGIKSLIISDNTKGLEEMLEKEESIAYEINMLS